MSATHTSEPGGATRPRRLVPASTVVIVVDVQERLAPAMPPDRLARVLRNIDVLLFAAERLGAPVLATEQYPSGLGRTVPPIAEALSRRAIVPIEKITFSALDTPAFAAALDALSVASAVVVGVETHVCVFQTVRSLVERGLAVYVAVDAVASRAEEHRAVGLSLCERAGAFATTAETVAFDWLREAGSDAFRAVSKYLR